MYAALLSAFFFFNDTATTEIYTLSLHDALPILTGEWKDKPIHVYGFPTSRGFAVFFQSAVLNDSHKWNCDLKELDRKSTRLNSSHQIISYAVFCLKKKKPQHHHT